jgi:hypothetical protein
MGNQETIAESCATRSGYYFCSQPVLQEALETLLEGHQGTTGNPDLLTQGLGMHQGKGQAQEDVLRG